MTRKNNCQFLIIGFGEDGEKRHKGKFSSQAKKVEFVHLRKIKKSGKGER